MILLELFWWLAFSLRYVAKVGDQLKYPFVLLLTSNLQKQGSIVGTLITEGAGVTWED